MNNKQFLNIDGLILYDKLIKDYLNDIIPDVPLEKGDADNSIQQVTAKALSETSIAIGQSSIAGCKAWWWKAYNPKTQTLYLTATQPKYTDIEVSNSAAYEEEGTWNISEGDIIAVINNIRVDYIHVISVNKNALTLKENIFSVANEDTRDFRYLVIDYTNPDAGIFDYGQYTAAFGNSKAVQHGAFAFGTNCDANGAWSVAGGRNSSAGFLACAIGNGNYAKGTYSTSFGSECESNGSCAFSTGSGTIAQAPYSFAIGRFTKAQNQASVVTGVESASFADFSSAHGYRTSATNKAQFVVGRYNKETDPNHENKDATTELFIVGNGSASARSNAFVVSNFGSIILHTGATGKNVYASVAAGTKNIVNGSNSIIGGRNGVINSVDSVLVGATNDDGFTSEINANNSAAFGMGVKVRNGHRASTVTGFGTKSSNPYCLIGGLYNAGISGNLFEIGNGNSTTGSNAFSVARTGEVTLGAHPTSAMHATTKQYVDGQLSDYNHELARLRDSLPLILELDENIWVDFILHGDENFKEGIATGWLFEDSNATYPELFYRSLEPMRDTVDILNDRPLIIKYSYTAEYWNDSAARMVESTWAGAVSPIILCERKWINPNNYQEEYYGRYMRVQLGDQLIKIETNYEQDGLVNYSTVRIL